MARGQVLVVRVYRFLRRSGTIAGLLEVTETGQQRPFRSFRELRQVMFSELEADASLAGRTRRRTPTTDRGRK
ncbi:MAG TPA: hypothetical protein VMP00_00480 [Burkholderiales bacterium]|nr:hypothetical protein [Burkholderiales bacterium]